MGDLERACSLLAEGAYTCVVCKDNVLYTSATRGVRPLLDWTAAGTDLHGFSAADKVVGKAAALLFVRAGIVRLYAHVLSEPALAVLQAHGIPVEYGTLVPGIINRSGDGPCPMEAAVSGTEDPEEAIRLIRQKLAELNGGAGKP